MQRCKFEAEKMRAEHFGVCHTPSCLPKPYSTTDGEKMLSVDPTSNNLAHRGRTICVCGREGRCLLQGPSISQTFMIRLVVCRWPLHT